MKRYIRSNDVKYNHREDIPHGFFGHISMNDLEQYVGSDIWLKYRQLDPNDEDELKWNPAFIHSDRLYSYIHLLSATQKNGHWVFETEAISLWCLVYHNEKEIFSEEIPENELFLEKPIVHTLTTNEINRLSAVKILDTLGYSVILDE